MILSLWCVFLFMITVMVISVIFGTRVSWKMLSGRPYTSYEYWFPRIFFVVGSLAALMIVFILMALTI